MLIDYAQSPELHSNTKKNKIKKTGVEEYRVRVRDRERGEEGRGEEGRGVGRSDVSRSMKKQKSQALLS